MGYREEVQRLYSTREWRARREDQLTREPLCRMCRQLGRVTAASVADHVKPHRGNLELFWEGELQSLCDSCHSSHKQAQEKSGYLRGCDINGWPLDPTHPFNKGG